MLVRELGLYLLCLALGGAAGGMVGWAADSLLRTQGWWFVGIFGGMLVGAFFVYTRFSRVGPAG
mgnify:CR=1 FL=1|jgi:FtsH-binding integral membrane protein